MLCRIRLHRISNSSRRSRIRPVVYRRDESSRSRDPIIDGYRGGGDDDAFEDLFFETVGRRVENLLPVIFDYVMGYASDYEHPPLRPLFFPGMSFPVVHILPLLSEWLSTAQEATVLDDSWHRRCRFLVVSKLQGSCGYIEVVFESMFYSQIFQIMVIMFVQKRETSVC